MIRHPKDIEYFKDYPAKVMELIHSAHFTNINHTIAFFGPMMYFLIRALKCRKVLEIGSAEGYTAWYMAHAIKDNAKRHDLKDPMYYGIDIVKTEDLKNIFTVFDLPNTVINLNTTNLCSDTFKDIQFDLVFQDGSHDKKHVLHEIEVLYPQLKGNGLGYWIFHDCMGPASEAFDALKWMIYKNIYSFQYAVIDDGIYGLTILRKMEGYVDRKYPY